MTVGITYLTDSFLEQYDDAAWVERAKKLLEQSVPGAGLEDFSCEIVPCRIGDRTLSGLKSSYLWGGVRIYQVEISWIDGDHLNDLFITSYMQDDCDRILDHFHLLKN